MYLILVIDVILSIVNISWFSAQTEVTSVNILVDIMVNIS